MGAKVLGSLEYQGLRHPGHEHFDSAHIRCEGTASVTALGHNAHKSAGSILQVDQGDTRVALQEKGKGLPFGHQAA